MTEKRFLTTHVGSLPRPEALLDLVFAREGGEAVSEEAFDAAVEEATAYVIKRQIEAVMLHADQTRSQRLIAEWDLVVRELTTLLAALFRVAFGYRRAAGDTARVAGLQEEVELPGQEELPLRILRMLPAAAREAWTLEVDPRFAAHAERYVEVFERFVDRVPVRGGAQLPVAKRRRKK